MKVLADNRNRATRSASRRHAMARAMNNRGGCGRQLYVVYGRQQILARELSNTRRDGIALAMQQRYIPGECHCAECPECPEVECTEDWEGCIGGSFTVPGDYTNLGGFTISGGLAIATGAGMIYKTVDACGSALNQEAAVVYNKVNNFTTSGNPGYREVGAAVRCAGAGFGSSSCYAFTARVYNGNPAGGTCENGANLIWFRLIKRSGGTRSVLTSASIAGRDLAKGITLRITAEVEGSGARVQGFAGGVTLSHLDNSPLASGRIGMLSDTACGGVASNPDFSFIKGRNL